MLISHHKSALYERRAPLRAAPALMELPVLSAMLEKKEDGSLICLPLPFHVLLEIHTHDNVRFDMKKTLRICYHQPNKSTILSNVGMKVIWGLPAWKVRFFYSVYSICCKVSVLYLMDISFGMKASAYNGAHTVAVFIDEGPSLGADKKQQRSSWVL